jgi:hypothetical protein
MGAGRRYGARARSTTNTPARSSCANNCGTRRKPPYPRVPCRAIACVCARSRENASLDRSRLASLAAARRPGGNRGNRCNKTILVHRGRHPREGVWGGVGRQGAGPSQLYSQDITLAHHSRARASLSLSQRRKAPEKGRAEKRSRTTTTISSRPPTCPNQRRRDGSRFASPTTGKEKKRIERPSSTSTQCRPIRGIFAPTSAATADATGAVPMRPSVCQASRTQSNQ